MIKNILKIVVLGILGFSALVYFTASKPAAVVASENRGNSITKESLPQSFELVGQQQHISKDDLFKANAKSLIVVGNHDSLAVVKDLNKYFPLEVPFVMVANISTAPWFVKKMFIPSKLEELNKGSNVPMIYDFDGHMVQSLGVTNNDKTAFIAYLIEENDTVVKIYEGKVKEGALDASMNDEEKKEALKPLVELLNDK